MIRQTSKIALIALAAIAFVVLIALGGTYWRLTQGPISLSFVKAPVEEMINSRIGDLSVRIRDAVIERDSESGAVNFRLRGLQLSNPRGQVIARTPRAAFGLSGSALLGGEVIPTRLELIGPRIKLSRQADGSIELGFSEGEAGDTADPASSKSDAAGTESASAVGVVDVILRAFSEGSDASRFASALELIAVRNAEISLFDENNNALWQAPNANLDFRRVSDGVSLAGSVRVKGNKLPWQLQLLANYSKSSDKFSVVARVSDLVPAELAGKLSVLHNFAQVRLPLSGRVAVEVDRTGKVVAGDAHLSAGAGYVGFPGIVGVPVVVDEGTLNLKLDVAAQELVFEDSSLVIGGVQTGIGGKFVPETREGVLQGLGFVVVADTRQNENKVVKPVLDVFKLAGRADVIDRNIEISELSILSGKAQIALSGEVTEGDTFPGVKIRGGLKSLPVSTLKKIWPPLAGRGARIWALENLRGGLITEAKVNIDLRPEDVSKLLEDLPVAHERMDLTFSYRGVGSKYLGELPIIRNGKGRARLRGDDFEVLLESAHVNVPGGKRLKLSKGRFFIPAISPVGPVSEITAVISGRTSDVLTVLDQPPLGYMTAFGLNPKSVGGNAAVSLGMKLPLLKNLTLDKINLRSRAKLNGLKLANAFGKAGIDGGTLDMTVTTKGLSAKGKVKLNGVSAALQWKENFNAARGQSSQYVIETQLGAKERQQIGIDLTNFVSGPVGVKVVAAGRGPDIDSALIEASLSKARLFYKPIGWRYSSKKAKAKMGLKIEKDKILLRDIQVSGPNLLIKGALELDNEGRLLKAELPNLNLGPVNRISVAGARNRDGVLVVKANASEFDARPLLRDLLKSPGGDKGTGQNGKKDSVSVTGNVRRAQAFNGETINNIRFAVNARGEDVQTLTSTGVLKDSAKFKIAIKPGDKGKRAMRIDAGNAGRMLRAVDLYSKIRGGDFRLSVNLPPPGAKSSLDGELKLKRFRVRNEAAFREIPQARAREDGVFAKASKANSFDFSSLKIPFKTRGDELRIRNALLKGNAIGASADGSVNTKTDAIRLGGTLIPAYGLNSIVSHVPLIGDILAGGKGKGVFGVTFAVTGTTARPRITINPVSALAPGLLRRMFEFGANPDVQEPGNRVWKSDPAYR